MTIPGEPLAARYNWCQGPAVEKHWSKGRCRKPPQKKNTHRLSLHLVDCLRPINSLKTKNIVKMIYEKGCHTDTLKYAILNIQRRQLRSGYTRTCYVTILMAGKATDYTTRPRRLNGKEGQSDEWRLQYTAETIVNTTRGFLERLVSDVHPLLWRQTN